MSTEELHIASLVVHTALTRLNDVVGEITSLPGACVHGKSEVGKLVVTFEAGSAEGITGLMSTVQRMDGVLSAALVYQCADRLEAMNEELPDAQT